MAFFWFGILLSFLGLLARVGSLRARVRAQFPRISDSVFDLFNFVLGVIGLGIVVVTYLVDVRQKEQTALALKVAQEMAAREAYVAASPDVKSGVVNKLRANYFAHAPIDTTVIVDFERDDQNRQLVGFEVLEFLRLAGIRGRRDDMEIMVSREEQLRPSLVLSCDPSMQMFAEQLLEALQPRLKTTNIVKHVQANAFQLQKHGIRLRLNGHPQFFGDGSIEFK